MPLPLQHLIHGAEVQISKGGAGRHAPHQLRSHHRCNLLHAALLDRRGRQLRAALPKHLVAPPFRQGLHQLLRFTGRKPKCLRPGWQTPEVGIGAMGHEGRCHRGVPELGLIRQIQTAAQHHPQRLR